MQYYCPGCLSLGFKNEIFAFYNLFKCSKCQLALEKENDPKQILFYKTFANHNRNGYKCNDCKRFIPHPLNSSITNIICPYINCMFTGNLDEMKKIFHPNSFNSSVIEIASSEENIKELPENADLLKSIIQSEYSTVPYTSSDFTVKQKFLIYKSFLQLLDSDAEKLTSYLLDNSRSGGFQHKIFQKYISLLEKEIPFSFKKKNIICNVDNLLSNNLNIFEGISTFESIVNENLEIKNETKEFYIGGRKATYAKPYYIGKLLNIINNDLSLMSHVTEYSFSKVKLTNVKPGTNVTVTHLRVPPHYQMGAMALINRIRKNIVDKTRLSNKENDE